MQFFLKGVLSYNFSDFLKVLLSFPLDSGSYFTHFQFSPCI